MLKRTYAGLLYRRNNVKYSTNVQNIKSFNAIPGPVKFPLIGNLYLYQLGIYKIEEYHRVLQHLYKQYGPLVKQNLGLGNTIVHVFDPDDAKNVYKEEGKMPEVSPLQETVQIYRKERNFSPGLGNTNGEEWYRLRSAVRQMMLRPREVYYYLPMINETALEFMRLIEKRKNSAGELTELRDALGKWSRESAGRICFETSLGCMDDGVGESLAQEMVDLNRKIFKLSGELKFSFPFYKYVKTPKWRSLIEAEDKFNSHGLSLIKQTIEQIRILIKENKLNEKEYNFMSYLLSKEELTEKDVAIITMSMFSDGLSTTVPTLLYNLHCLSVNEQVQERAWTEVNKVVGASSHVTKEHIDKLSYLKAVIKETFRVYPNGTEISRIIGKELVLSGYRVPAGTHVNLNQTVHFNDENYFKNSAEYEPERWLRHGDNVEEIHPYLLIPFGHGTRTCAGRRFAEQDLLVFLAQVLRKFKLTNADKQNRKLEQIYQTLLFPKYPLRICFNDRNN